MNRRDSLKSIVAGIAWPSLCLAATAPAERVAIGRCREYNGEVPGVLARMFDQLGGLERIVKGKTVAIKLNLGGRADARLGHRPHELSNWVHPQVIGNVIHQLAMAGATRIRLLEGSRYTALPLEEHMLEAGWEPRDLFSAASKVEMENTNVRGRPREYARLKTPNGGHLYPSFTLNRSYMDCDVFVSLAKLKEHLTTGVTLSMKNCFGITPTSIYGNSAGEQDPNEAPTAGRNYILHSGRRQPAKCAEPARNSGSALNPGQRVPRVIADIVAARPVHLAIIDGIHSMGGGEGVYGARVRPAHAGVLIAGTNCVNTDAVATAVMGFDPAAGHGTAPFEKCDSTLRLAAAHGLGTFDLKRIEVTGATIREVRYPFRKI